MSRKDAPTQPAVQQLRDDYEALKRELYATQEESKHLKDQLKQSKFGFDSIKDTNAKQYFFYRFTVIQNVYFNDWCRIIKTFIKKC